MRRTIRELSSGLSLSMPCLVLSYNFDFFFFFFFFGVLVKKVCSKKTFSERRVYFIHIFY